MCLKPFHVWSMFTLIAGIRRHKHVNCHWVLAKTDCGWSVCDRKLLANWFFRLIQCKRGCRDSAAVSTGPRRWLLTGRKMNLSGHCSTVKCRCWVLLGVFHWYSERAWDLWKLPVLRGQLPGDSGPQCGTHSWDVRTRNTENALYQNRKPETETESLSIMPCRLSFLIPPKVYFRHPAGLLLRLTPLCSPGTACWLTAPTGFVRWPFTRRLNCCQELIVLCCHSRIWSFEEAWNTFCRWSL